MKIHISWLSVVVGIYELSGNTVDGVNVVHGLFGTDDFSLIVEIFPIVVACWSRGGYARNMLWDQATCHFSEGASRLVGL